MMVQLPDVRNTVILRLQDLADPEYQERVWLRGEAPGPGLEDDFDTAINDFYDAFDNGKEIDPDGAIGVSLRSPAEAEVVREVLDPLDRVLRDSGQLAPFAQVRQNQAWSQVVEAARRAIEVLGRDE